MADMPEQSSSDAGQSVEGAPRFLLVMTATIVPAEGAGVKRADPALRLEDYKRALRYWLTYPHRAAERILFLENSGADLSQLRAIAARENPLGREVEFLSLPGNVIPPGSNYGYTEMQLLDDGLAASQLKRVTTHIIKVTGRLTFPAIGKAIDEVAPPDDAEAVPLELMVECRKLGFPRRGYDASVQLFACSHRFYDCALRGANREMNSTDVRLLEHLIYRKVIPFKGRPGYYLRFPCNIEPVGYSGFKASNYNSPKSEITRAVRAMLRVVAPWYWY
jgi:hypothetical protein